MGRSSRNSEEKVSFFAFQDIITAVIGILVLIALILALQVNPKREKEGENPGNNTAPVELIEGQNDGGGNATIVVASEFNASEVIEEIAQLHQEISNENENSWSSVSKRTARSNSSRGVEAGEHGASNLQEKAGDHRFQRHQGHEQSPEKSSAYFGFGEGSAKGTDEKKKGLEDQINARILREVADMSELELQQLDSQLNSQVEQLANQIENEVRVIPKENSVGEKPVLVILGSTEFTIGIFNGEQRTVQVTPATYYQQLGGALNSYDRKRNFFVFFFVHRLVRRKLRTLRAGTGRSRRTFFPSLRSQE